MTRTEKNQMLVKIADILEEYIEQPEANAVTDHCIPQVRANIYPADISECKMLTIKECTQIIKGVSAHTIRLLAAKGKIISLRTGESARGKILISKKSLLDYFGC